MLFFNVVAGFLTVVSYLPHSEGQLAYDAAKATWNSRGMKWDGVRHILNHDSEVDVIALQEVGAKPDSGSTFTFPERRECLRTRTSCSFNIPIANKNDGLSEGPFVTFFNPNGGYGPVPVNLDSVSEFVFQVGGGNRARSFYAYHYILNDVQNPRVNLAIVSRSRAEQVLIMAEDRVRRPVVGIRIGKKYYFSIHAGAFPANPAPITVEQIQKFLKFVELGDFSFVIMGDFNRPPTGNNPAAVPGISTSKIYPMAPTHDSGNIFDYAFIGRKGDNLNFPQFQVTVRPEHYNSDHFPVIFKKIVQ